MMENWGGGFGMGFGWIVPLVLIGLVIWAVRSLVGRQGERPAGGNTGNSGNALEILKARYARGEITREEFQAMRQDIE